MNAWETIAVQIIPEAPLQLGTESAFGNYELTAGTIPGAMLRGAVARATLAHCTHPDARRDHAACPARDACPFWQIFNPATEPLWGFAYPAAFGPAAPFPLTARTCKREGGYARKDQFGRTVGHGVYDALVGQLVDNLLGDPVFPHRADLQPDLRDDWASLPHLLRTTCPTCDEPLKSTGGVYTWSDTEGPLYAPGISTRRATHVGINRARGVAEDSLLFTQESLETPEVLSFHAQVQVPAAVWPSLEPYLADEVYYVGRGRSRGNGRVRLLGALSPAPDIAGRLARFNQAVNGAVARYKAADPRITHPLPGTLFSVTLRSPLLAERRGEPRAILDTEQLGIPEAHLVRAWARTEVVGGWDSAAQLPRRTRLAIQAGSVFVYWTPAPIHNDALVARLTALELIGCGAERARGYGHVTVCAPFHTWNRLDQA